MSGSAADCPGLVSPSELARWDVRFNFKERTVQAMGVTKKMLLTDTRHPGLDLLQFPNVLMGTKDRELAELRQQLVNAPQTYAFVTAAGEEEDLGTEDESSGNTSETESEEHELKKLLTDMESLEVPTRDYIQVSESEDDSYKGAFDGGESTTSHELGVEWPDSDSSTEVEERSYDEGEAYKGPVKAFTKGQKRKVRSGIRQLKEIHTLDKVRGHLKRSEPVTYKPRVPKKPYKVLEIFTWTLTVTMLAAQSGWIGLEPITLPHWDLRLPQERKAALNYVRAADPDLTVIAWPCTVWSQLQGLNVKTVEHAEALADRQMMDRDDFLSFVHDVAKDRRACGKAVVGENPLTSRAWKEPLIREAFLGPDCDEVRVDMCAYGLRRPDTKESLMKPTKLVGTKEIVRACEKRCSCERLHALTMGGMKHEGKSWSVAEFAGGYTKAFARRLLRAAEKWLDEGRSSNLVYATDTLPEEILTAPDEEVQLEKPADETPEEEPEEKYPKAVVEAVQKAHRRLGHPSKDAMVRMLKLGGASGETLAFAKEYVCPIFVKAERRPEDRCSKHLL